MAFRFWNSGPQTGAYHMAVDRVLFRRLEAGLSEPLIRIYSWSPWCVTLGYSQSPEREINLTALQQRGWTWARRPTGGRAVLHAHEFTYTVAASAETAPWCAHRDRSYARIGEALRLWVAEAGVEAQLARGDSALSAASSGPSRPCFSSTSRLELTWQGRKLAGSAQRRGRQGFVQHGSLPIDDSFGKLTEVLPVSDAVKQNLDEGLRGHAVSLQAAGADESAIAQMADKACEAFARGLGMDCFPAGLSPEEEEDVVAELSRENGRNLVEQGEGNFSVSGSVP